jgi:hypothetical protein
MTLEAFEPKGEKRAEKWKDVERFLSTMAIWREGGESVFIMGGDSPTLADFAVGGMIMWMKQIFGEDSPEWKSISTVAGGHWGALSESLKKYE